MLKILTTYKTNPSFSQITYLAPENNFKFPPNVKPNNGVVATQLALFTTRYA
jgi:hypothetical protein